jgi:hypothetical protein
MSKALSMGKVAAKEPVRVPTALKVILVILVILGLLLGGCKIWFYQNFVHPAYSGDDRDSLDRAPMAAVGGDVRIGPIDRRPGDTFVVMFDKKSGDFMEWKRLDIHVAIPSDNSLFTYHLPKGTSRVILMHADRTNPSGKFGEKYLYIDP